MQRGALHLHFAHDYCRTSTITTSSNRNYYCHTVTVLPTPVPHISVVDQYGVLRTNGPRTAPAHPSPARDRLYTTATVSEAPPPPPPAACEPALQHLGASAHVSRRAAQPSSCMPATCACIAV